MLPRAGFVWGFAPTRRVAIARTVCSPPCSGGSRVRYVLCNRYTWHQKGVDNLFVGEPTQSRKRDRYLRVAVQLWMATDKDQTPSLVHEATAADFFGEHIDAGRTGLFRHHSCV